MSIPVVDLTSEDWTPQLLSACEEFGFVSVTGHGIDSSVFDQMRSMCAQLFSATAETKIAGSVRPDNYRGFIPLGFFTPNRTEANGPEADRYEGYKLHWECPPDHPARAECELYGSNIWPSHVPAMAGTVGRYWQSCDRLADRLLPVFAQALGVEGATFNGFHDAPLTNMTLLHYPAQDPTDMSVGMHPHKDTNVLTFLHPGPAGGLKIRTTDGVWLDAQAPPDALLVNIGEMLELWSGGRFPATPHQVINRTGRERYSFPYFVVPNHAAVVAPLAERVPGFRAKPMPVGKLSAEVWRTNWPDEQPSDSGFDLGTLDRAGS